MRMRMVLLMEMRSEMMIEEMMTVRMRMITTALAEWMNRREGLL